MYKSPIELLVTNVTQSIENETEEMVFKAVQKCFPNVDRNEMFRALKYDRDQYEMGYADGKNEALYFIVRCEDCKHRTQLMGKPPFGFYACSHDKGLGDNVKEDDFCSYGERRE